MNDFQTDTKPVCVKHNQPAILFSKQSNTQADFLCESCFQSEIPTPIEDFSDQQKKQMFIKVQERSDLCLNVLKELLQSLADYKQNLFKLIDNLSQTLNDQSQIIKDKQSNFKSLFQISKASSIEIIKNEKKSIMNLIYKLNDQLNIELTKFIEQTKLTYESKVDNMFQILNKLNPKFNLDYEEYKNKSRENQVSIIGGQSTKSNIMDDQQFDYQLIQQLTYKQNEVSHAIAFNQDATIMIAGCNQLIKVFEFTTDKLNEVQQLNGHTNSVYCLQFMKKSNEFISGSYDSTMIIWKYNKNYLWQYKQILKGHQSCLYCIAINKNENMLISGSMDCRIKFWLKQNKTWDYYQSIDCQKEVLSISLSDQENQLITSVKNNLILVIQQQDKQWMIKQKISVYQEGFRLCFIKQDQFVFQSSDKQHLLIFDYDPKDQNFKKRMELQYPNKGSDYSHFFPIRYISQIGLIMIKHGDHIYLIKSQDGKLRVQQSINFGTNFIFGGITDDGRYIATWDSESSEIQLRKFYY